MPSYTQTNVHFENVSKEDVYTSVIEVDGTVYIRVGGARIFMDRESLAVVFEALRPFVEESL